MSYLARQRAGCVAFIFANNHESKTILFYVFTLQGTLFIRFIFFVDLPTGIRLKACLESDALEVSCIPIERMSEWAVHPGLDIEPVGNRSRQTDVDFLTSRGADEILKEEGIILLDYRALQNVWVEM